MSELRHKLIALGCVLTMPVFAVSVDQSTFKKYGGDVMQVGKDIRTKGVFDQLREYSYARPWLGVGNVGFEKNVCTATWIGEEVGEDDEWSYVLTAAHCLGRRPAAESPINASLVVSGVTIAQGQGVAYVPGDRLKDASLDGVTDIAILKLPRHRTPLDNFGMPLEKPIFNDSKLENGKTVIFVGYGDWGVGDKADWSYMPKSGERRLYARNVAKTLPRQIEHHELRLAALFNSYGPSANWGKLQNGDSGSAWWQFQNGMLTMVGVTSQGGGVFNLATRISAYAGWIKNVYPAARMLAEEGPKGCLILADAVRKKFCLGPGENYRLPDWIYSKGIDIQADSGITVTISDVAGLPPGRLASFNGTVENSLLRRVEVKPGKRINVMKPRSMRVELAGNKPLGCVISLVSTEKFCLTPDSSVPRKLPAWIRGQDIFVQADAGASVVLYDTQSNGARFSGTVQNYKLKQVSVSNGIKVDLSQPDSMSVVKS